MSKQAKRHGQKPRTAARRKQESQGNYFMLKVTGFSINGKPGKPIDYERTEHADGTVEEKGRPDGIPADLPLTGEGGVIERMIEYVAR